MEIVFKKKKSDLNIYSCETYKSFKFSAGEVHIKLKGFSDKLKDKKLESIELRKDLRSSDDIMELLLTKNIIDNIKNKYNLNFKCEFFTKYLPYSRQDRIINEDEPFSLLVISDLINNLKFDKITVHDVHSETSKILIKNLHVTTKEDALNDLIKDEKFKKDFDSCRYMIAPDAGAFKETYSLAQKFEKEAIIANKVRNVKDGKIIKTQICDEGYNLKGENVFIADDIIDGGMTLIKLVEMLKEKEVNEIYVYTTHGIFSKGKDVLFDSGVDKIYTRYEWNEDIAI